MYSNSKRRSGVCGRFVRKTDIVQLGELFGAHHVESDLGPSFNVAPSQPVAVIIEAGERKLVPMQWGLIPNWADAPSIANKLINARSETIMTKPSFRNSFKRRRCLVLADGFYEWETVEKEKQPVYIFRKDRAPFGMAGVYDCWLDPESGERSVTCTIITTEAPEAMKQLHHRMPAIIPPEHYQAWLDPAYNDYPFLTSLLKPFAPAGMEWHRISKKVNKAGYDSPDCILPSGR